MQIPSKNHSYLANAAPAKTGQGWVRFGLPFADTAAEAGEPPGKRSTPAMDDAISSRLMWAGCAVAYGPKRQLLLKPGLIKFLNSLVDEGIQPLTSLGEFYHSLKV